MVCLKNEWTRLVIQSWFVVNLSYPTKAQPKAKGNRIEIVEFHSEQSQVKFNRFSYPNEYKA